MRHVGLALCLVGLGLTCADAQDRKFPYEAVVDADEELVRCGPGPKYYPTGKLKRGERVTVHRHDPGGWSMIAPPPTSFSWVQAEYVQRLASGKGTLTANNVVAHVGSTLGDDRGVYQRTLSRGDTVEILGEATVATERGPVAMYKIKPPLREYRWIPGRSLIPVEGGRAAPVVKPRGPLDPAPSLGSPIALELDDTPRMDLDPFAPAAPSPEGAEPPRLNPPTAPRLGGEPGEPPLSSAVETPPEGLDGLRKQLELLDKRFRETLRQTPETWDLASLEQAYLQLDEAADHPAFHSHVQQRLYTLKRYGKIRQDYVDFYQLTSETQQRDAQLLSMQRLHEEKLKQLDTIASSAPPTSPLAGMSPPFSHPGSTPAQPSTPGTPAGTPPQFAGAGIVQRSNPSAPGRPAYVLVTPDGRLLAYLEPTSGVDLAPAVNQALGIQGQRSFRPELQADVIIVSGMQPVRLRTR
jgi:hypothetical protein